MAAHALTEKELKCRAKSPRPETGSAEYFQWRRARLKLGLPVKGPYKLSEQRRKYLREWARARRRRQKRGDGAAS